jgi:mRNA interferase ChpB
MRWPKRGDIWRVNLNPVVGKEQEGFRPVFVVSEEAFNRSGLTLICPITQGGNQTRFAGFAISLMGAGTQTQGVVMSNQVRTIDVAARQGKFVETAPDFLIGEVLAKLQAIVE